jgi:5'-3' exonuclease
VAIVDASFICWQSFHAMKSAGLRVGDIQTGMLFGVMKSIISIAERWQTNQFVWCFDSPPTLRKAIYPEYKENRKPRTEAEQELRFEVKLQMAFVHEVLGDLGFKNRLRAEGFEADDLVATIAEAVRCSRQEGNDVRGMIISADKDLWQCLSKGVSICSGITGVEPLTKRKFIKAYGISPAQWAEVKAMTGCKGDNVPGIVGIGDASAVKYLRGELKQGSVALNSIESKASQKIVKKSRKLVTLPMAGVPVFHCRENDLTISRWTTVMKQLGMESLVKKYPF